MEYHYNAFISYNHNPRDMKIARLLQRKLENYKVPREVLSSDHRKIERVFLDTGELEVSGDLNDVIRDALKNSDFLIVICSPESKTFTYRLYRYPNAAVYDRRIVLNSVFESDECRCLFNFEEGDEQIRSLYLHESENWYDEFEKTVSGWIKEY